MLKIVILDGYCANPGDLSWKDLEKFGSLTVYDRTSPAEVPERSKGAEILLTNKTILSAETIAALPDLKYIGVLATGTNIVDIEAAHSRGIIVTNVPAYSTDSVAQTVFALLLAISNHAEGYAAMNREGEWSRCPDFSYQTLPLVELAGKRMGIVGYGNIGSKVAEIAHAFGMIVSAFSSKSSAELPEWISKASMDELIADSDVVSLHCPLTENTRHLINAEHLDKMKPSAILINTARGPLIDEHALAQALISGKIKAAGLDVLEKEPPAPENPLLKLANCYITPHIGWATPEARRRLMDVAVANVEAFIEGKPQNMV